MPTSTSYKSAPTRIQVSNQKKLLCLKRNCHTMNFSSTEEVIVIQTGCGLRYFLPKQKNIFLAIPCDIFGMVKRAPFKGESWPPTIGDNKKVTNWNHLDIIIPGSYLFPQRIPPPKKHQRSVRYVTPTLISITGSLEIPNSQVLREIPRPGGFEEGSQAGSMWQPMDHQFPSYFQAEHDSEISESQIWESEHILKQDRNRIS